MPTYQITAPNGKQLEVTGDHMPTEAELHDIFAKAGVDTGTPPSLASRTAGAVAGAAPAIGGMVGGMTGGVAGAAAGGMAGEGYRQLIEHAKELPGAVADVARNVIAQPAATLAGFKEGATQGLQNAALQGGGQAAGELAGEGIVAGGSKLAKWLMNRATTRVTTRLAQEFPELSDTLIDNALSVSQGGYEKARALLAAAKAPATEAVKAADQADAQIPIALSDDLANSLKTALIEKAVKAGTVPKPVAGEALTVASKRLTPATQALFKDIEAAVEAGTPFNLTASQADLLKTQLQKESRALYLNRVAANGPKALTAEATERAELASRLNDAIESVASGYKAANAAAQPLIGAVRGIKQAIRPNGNLMQAFVRPAIGATLGGSAGTYEGGVKGGAIGSVLGAAATSPANLSREAIVLAHPVIQTIMRQLPKPAAQMLTDFLIEHVAPASGVPSPQSGGSQ